MSGKSTVTIRYKTEDVDGGFKQMVVSAETFNKVMGANIVEAAKFQKQMINFATVSTSLDSLSNVFNNILSVSRELTEAFRVQQQAETQLEQVMRNRMAATAEDVDAIKELCSAQQQLGVIGDEVQLAGAKELASFLSQKESLMQLIPVMNDMIAKQYGLNASSEGASQVARLLGKVMEGQTNALKRYGITFTEVQAAILEFGTETEKAAMLSQVLEASWGGVNRELANTESGKIKQIENNIGDLKEKIGEVFSNVQPFLTFGASLTTSLTGVMRLINGLKALSAAMKALHLSMGWVSAAFAAVSVVVGLIATNSANAAKSIDEMSEAEKRAARAAEEQKAMTEAVAEAYGRAKTQIDGHIQKVGMLVKAGKEDKALVEELNRAYGSRMGKMSTLSDWYKTLIKNSEDYCRQMMIEARINSMKSTLEKLHAEKNDLLYDEYGNPRSYSKDDWGWVRATKEEYEKAPENERKYKSNPGAGGGASPEYYVKGKSSADVIDQKISIIDRGINNLMKNLAESREEAASIFPETTAVTPSTGGGGGGRRGTGKTTELTRLQVIAASIEALKEKYLKANEEERASIRKKINDLEDEKNTLELLKSEAELPADYSSLQDYEKALSYLGKARQMANKDEIEEIDELIKKVSLEKSAFEVAGHAKLESYDDFSKMIAHVEARLQQATGEEIKELMALKRSYEEQQKAFERNNHLKIDPEKITSYRRLEEEIAFYTELLQEGTDEERKFATENLPALQKKRKEMELLISSVGVASKPQDAKTLDELSAAISLFDEKINQANADEIDGYQRTKMAFEKKKEALERGIRIPQMENEISEIERLSGKDFRIKVKGIGFEGLKEKIAEIQKMLNDIDNPPTEGQRRALERMKETYESWLKVTVNGWETFTSGWSNVKSISSSVDSMTKALEGNATIWEKTITVIDGFISIINSFQAILGIMEMLGVISKANTAAKEEETVATVAAMIAHGAEAAEAEVLAAANAPVIAANKAATTSFLELAAAEYLAAHASIPFAGFGIAEGFTTAAKFLVESIGAIPFASGGIVSGPTLGLIGEYAGASNNPEVVAPLDKLKHMIGGSPAKVVVTGEFKLRNKTLVAAVSQQTQIDAKSGKKTKIKI